jgi:CIC family chloride channel protein
MANHTVSSNEAATRAAKAAGAPGGLSSWVLSRVQLPSWPLLPIAGAIVGIYSGLAAGALANGVGFLTGLALGEGRLWAAASQGPGVMAEPVWKAFREAQWHPEYALGGIPLAFMALWFARGVGVIGAPEEQQLAQRRLRTIGLLLLGAIALYYQLVVLAALNAAFGYHEDLLTAIQEMPFWARVLTPAAGGLVVGMILKGHPEVWGHGIPEVVGAVDQGGKGIDARAGIIKLIASSVTIGSGGSTGREGPITFGAGAIAASVGRTLGFSEKELCALIAGGAGAGIAASFNAPLAGAIFGLEIILRKIELRVLSPILLASATATMVGQAVLGNAPVLEHLDYKLLSSWELFTYALLGVLIGVFSFGFTRLLHHVEGFFTGKWKWFFLSRWLGLLPLPLRACVGGALVGLMTIFMWEGTIIWGSGHEYVNLSLQDGKLSAWQMATSAVAKVIGTVTTLGSGGAGGLFFPSAVLGSMTGGTLGGLLHSWLPETFGRAGAYATVGMGGAVAAILRGPMMALVMVYELSGDYEVMLPLMITCTISSELCHALRQRSGAAH